MYIELACYIILDEKSHFIFLKWNFTKPLSSYNKVYFFRDFCTWKMLPQWTFIKANNKIIILEILHINKLVFKQFYFFQKVVFFILCFRLGLVFCIGVSYIGPLHFTLMSCSSLFLIIDCSNSKRRILSQNHLNCDNICCHKYSYKNIFKSNPPVYIQWSYVFTSCL